MDAQTTNMVTSKTQGPPPNAGSRVSFQDPGDPLPSPTTSIPPTSSDSRYRGKDTASLSDVDIAGLVDTPPEDMEGMADGYTRRRSSLMDGITAGRDKSRSDKKTQPHGEMGRRQGGIDEGDEQKGFSDDGQSSDFSSRSTSEDVELDDISSDDGLDGEETGLTKEDRRRKRRRKRRHTRMNERIAGDARASRGWKNLANQSVLKRSLINALLIGLWYCFSLSISIYNTWMFSPGHLDFHFPLFTTSLHMVVQFSMASLVLWLFPCFRPGSDPTFESHQHAQTQHNAAKNEKPLMTRTFYITRIGPCGAATGLDIGLGNMSLKFITLTFYTMCKSSSLAFVLLFAFLFRLEAPSIKLILIIATMTVGVVMMVAGETAFNTLGFILVISAAFFSGFRWGLTQILLLRNPATSNPFSSIFYLAPIMFLSLLLIALPVEGPRALAAGLAALTQAKGTFTGIAILLFPGLLAFLMTSSEFALLQRTSVVTLSICGIFKEVVTISAAGIVFHDPLTPINVSGLLVTIASIAAYNYIKISKMRHDAKSDIVQHDVDDDVGAREPMLAATDVVADEGDGRAGAQQRPQPRISTSGLANAAVRSPGASIQPPREAVHDVHIGTSSPARTSPVKRPEDLE